METYIYGVNIRLAVGPGGVCMQVDIETICIITPGIDAGAVSGLVGIDMT
jgi:hypothetical protein